MGLAHQWYGGTLDSASIYQRLAAAESEGAQRDLEILTAASLLKQASASQREAVAYDLLRLWREETEPELRIAIARIVGTTFSVGDEEP